MAFQPELVLEGVEDAVDPLAHAAKRPEPAWFVLAIRADQPCPQLADALVERAAGKALVGQDDRARGQCLLAGGIVQQRLGDLALAQARGGQAPGDRHAVRGAEQVQLEAPVPAAVAAVIAVGGLAPQGRALDRLARGATWKGRGVQQPEPIAPRRRADRQVSQHEPHQVSGSAQALVVAGLAGQIREQVAQPVMGEPQPMALRTGAQQHLGDGQTDQLRVAELWRAARPEPGTNQLVEVTYSAVTRSSRQACTTPPWRSTLREQRLLSATSLHLS